MGMLNLYRYMVETGMKKFSGVPYPYNRMLDEELQADVASGKITKEEYERVTGQPYPEPQADEIVEE
jgi:Phage uncharacterised protein (Phage_XkdX)